ncbi:uncharacterized protein C3orf14 homolog [Acanthochromis polyacanthus]|uniref:uncharacterized protein C3orf14 homolog n=1 Tax=Acanthochromis polyacanthus TaxID=80966 RepID=UPI00223470BC|nr:uncharacterized protein C3orf14 homolog [Acanthochromis polyacanthus]
MCASVAEHVGFMEKHEEILGRRAELLEQMKVPRDYLNIQRMKQVKQCEAAGCRNTSLLQDLQKIEDRLKARQLPHQNLLTLEAMYWASVEEFLPAWENFLLGKGPHPTGISEPPPRRAKQKPGTAKNQGLPPRPKLRTAR